MGKNYPHIFPPKIDFKETGKNPGKFFTKIQYLKKWGKQDKQNPLNTLLQILGKGVKAKAALRWPKPALKLLPRICLWYLSGFYTIFDKIGFWYKNTYCFLPRDPCFSRNGIKMRLIFIPKYQY